MIIILIVAKVEIFYNEIPNGRETQNFGKEYKNSHIPAIVNGWKVIECKNSFAWYFTNQAYMKNFNT